MALRQLPALLPLQVILMNVCGMVAVTVNVIFSVLGHRHIEMPKAKQSGTKGGSLKHNLSSTLILCAILCFASASAFSAEETGQDYIIITSEGLEAVTRDLETGIARVAGLTRPKELRFDGPEAKALLERLGVDFIPYVIFDRKIEGSDKFFDLARNGMIARKNGEYVIPENMFMQGVVMLFKRKHNPLELDLFLVSEGPAGKEALREIGGYLEKEPAAFKVTCHYISTFREFGIDALHGPGEIKENIHQLLIQKYHPDKFWKYQKSYTEGKGFEAACKEAGIDVLDINKRQEEGIELLRQDADLCKELGISASPTFLWENRMVMSNLQAFRQTALSKKFEERLKKPRPEGAFLMSVFHSSQCENCYWLLDEYIPGLEKEYGERIAFEYYDITIQENFKKKLAVDGEHGVIAPAVPEVVIGKEVLVGIDEIKARMKDLIDRNLAQAKK